MATIADDKWRLIAIEVSHRSCCKAHRLQHEYLPGARKAHSAFETFHVDPDNLFSSDMLGKNPAQLSSSSGKFNLNRKIIVVAYSEDGIAFQLRRNVQTGLLELVETSAEYFILKALAKSMNFSVHVTTPADRKWGTRMENGSFNGMVGQVASGAADMALGQISLTEDRKTVVDFSYVCGSEEAGFAMRRPERLHGGFEFFRIFSKEVSRSAGSCWLLGELLA
jgi:hypothetical protein